MATARPSSSPTQVLVAGGGVAALELLMSLAELGDGRLRVALVSEHPTFALTPQMVGAPWGGPPLEVDLEQACRAFGARFVIGRVEAVDPAARRIALADGETLDYDELVVATGASLRPAYPDGPGTLLLGRDPLPAAMATADARDLAIVVPPGQRWSLPAYELALLATDPARERRVALHTWEPAPLAVFGPGAARPVAAFLWSRGVQLRLRHVLPVGSDVTGLVGPQGLVVTLPLAAARTPAGLPTDADGFLSVDERQALPGVPSIHAIGDVIATDLRQGGLAAQQADVVATELLRSAGLPLPAASASAPVLRGRLTQPGADGLYLRRVLDGADAGIASVEPLWDEPGAVCSRRLSRWLAEAPGRLLGASTEHVARPAVPA